MTQKDKLLIGYLCYLNDSNQHRRINNFEKSVTSLSLLQEQPCDVIAVMNDCNMRAHEMIAAQTGIDEIVTFKENMWDICVIYVCAKLAKQRGYEYCCYTYDDFVIFDKDFVGASLSFMKNNDDVGCLRIPYYEYNKMHIFDSEITPKSINPDAVRHYSNNHVQKAPLFWEGPFAEGNQVFYKNNWHYTSRPCIWKTEVLLSFFENVDEVPVTQPFEKYAAIKFHETKLKTGVLDKGAMYTFLQSERTNSQSSLGLTAKVNVAHMHTQMMKDINADKNEK